MDIVIKIIGVLFVVLAFSFQLRPDIITSVMEFFRQGKRLYLAAVMRILLAIVFFLGATACKIKWLIITLGILFLISGLLIFIIRLEKLKSIINWFLRQPNVFLRVLALIALLLGVIIVCAA